MTPFDRSELGGPLGDSDIVTIPSKEDIIQFIQENPDRATKRDIARAFGLKGSDKIPLKRLLRELADDGVLKKGQGKRLREAGDLPPIGVIEIFDTDADQELLARPVSWEEDRDPPKIILAPTTSKTRYRQPPLGIGDRALARLIKMSDGTYEARVMRKLEKAESRIIGVYQKVGRDGVITPVDKRSKHEYSVRREDAQDAQTGELVTAEPLGRRGRGNRSARITERIGDTRQAKTVSLIAIHTHNIPFVFAEAVIRESEKLTACEKGDITDLTHLPFVTIDPADARDHDDAVFCESDTDPENKDGWIVWVAIADVARYVKPGSSIDAEARRRGNSCYFPDRVVPMLPEKLSNDLCSLHEGVPRASLAVRMVFDRDGNKKSHRFIRCLINSAASLSYSQFQDAVDGRPDETAFTLLHDTILPLWNAYKAMASARDKRSPLDLDLPEHRIELDKVGRVSRIALRERLEAHRLIEEMMVMANVCAAETLEKQKTPLIYRVHEPPSDEKAHALQEFLRSIEIKAPKGQRMTSEMFNRILSRTRNTEFEDMISVVVLRSQSQAQYSPENLGHFGLNLSRYAHFTSPIRRYADLIVHRALIRACKLGTDGLTDKEADDLEEIAAAISICERRAMMAERDSNDRYIAAFMEDKVGATFSGRVAGVTRFGLFIRLHETGADGLVPIRSLGFEHFYHDESAHSLVGEQSGDHYRLAQEVTVELIEAMPLTGGLIFQIVSEPLKGKPGRGRSVRGKRIRGAGKRRSNGPHRKGRRTKR